MNDIVERIDGVIRDWAISGDAVRWTSDPDVLATPVCLNCERRVRPLASSSTGWTHGVERGDWQGVRCPGRICGAWPGPLRLPD